MTNTDEKKLKYQSLLGILLLIGNFFILLYGVATVFPQNFLGIVVTVLLIQTLEIGAGFYTVETFLLKKILPAVLSLLFLLSISGIEGYLAYRRTLLADKPQDLAILAGILSFLIPIIAAIALSRVYLLMTGMGTKISNAVSTATTGLRVAGGIGTEIMGRTFLTTMGHLEDALLTFLALVALPFVTVKDGIEGFFKKRKWW